MIRRARIAGLFVLMAGAALTAGQTPAPAAQQTPTFKVEVNYVEVDALVVDRQGNFVRDLKKEDFQVFEDGKSQTVAAFSLVDIPIERFERPLFAVQPIEPDVKTNARPFDGRVYVMVVDDLHTLFGRTDRVKKAARQFIERNLGANDLTAVVYTSGRADAGQEFTSNKRLLLAAVDRVMGRKVRSATLGRTEEYYNTRDIRQQGDRVNDPDDAERGFNARSTLLTLKNVAEWFGGVHGRRKAVLFFSEGIDYDINDVFNNSSASTILEDTRDVISAATRSNVSIYAVDPRGLTQLGDETIEVGNFPDDTSLGIGTSSIMNEVRLSQDSLRVLADETGGFASVNRNDFATAYDRVVKDNSSYYVLAYYPPSDKRDGKFHNITVRVTRPGLVVRARKGYAAPKGKAPAPARASADNVASVEVREALTSPLPISGVTLHVFAAPFKGAPPNASVLLGAEMRGRDLKLTDQTGKANNKVELSFSAIDAQGKVRGGNTDAVTLNLRPETLARVEQTGLRLLNRLDLPPGRYQMRVAAHDTTAGTLGSVILDLEVPDFTKGPLLMSGLVLTSAAGSVMPTARPDELLKPMLPGPPVASRQFAENDELVLFAEIYDNEASSPHTVDVTTTVTADEGKVMFKTEEQRASSELQGKRGGYGYTARIALKDLQPGSYVLRVEARSRLGEGATASREVMFAVGRPSPAPSAR